MPRLPVRSKHHSPRPAKTLDGQPTDEDVTRELVQGLFESELFCREFLNCSIEEGELHERVLYIQKNAPTLQLKQWRECNGKWVCWLVPYEFVALPVAGFTQERRLALSRCVERRMFYLADISLHPCEVNLTCFARNDLVGKQPTRILRACYTYLVNELEQSGLRKQLARDAALSALCPSKEDDRSWATKDPKLIRTWARQQKNGS